MHVVYLTAPLMILKWKKILKIFKNPSFLCYALNLPHSHISWFIKVTTGRHFKMLKCKKKARIVHNSLPTSLSFQVFQAICFLDLTTLNISGLSTLHWRFILSILKFTKFLKGYRNAMPRVFLLPPCSGKTAFTVWQQAVLPFWGVHSPTLKLLKRQIKLKTSRNQVMINIQKLLWEFKSLLKKRPYVKAMYLLKIDLPYQRILIGTAAFF